jgi:transcriptional regulator with XRE-family HTH domain
MGTAAQIRHHRVRAGKSRREVAAHLGLNDAWYGDLEKRDGELEETLTLFQAMELASFLGVHLRDLAGNSDSPRDSVSLLDLPALIEAHMAREAVTLEQFEEEVGWELGDFLKSPLRATAELPILFLQAVTAPLGIGWLSLVPDDDLPAMSKAAGRIRPKDA